MNHLMRTLISLQHLTKAKSKGGQVATLLLLLLVIMLVFVMVTVNLGNVAVDSTRIANAADSAVLQLASALATKAKQLYTGLGGYEHCQKTGLLAIVLAVIVAIIAIVVTVVTYGGTWSSVPAAVTMIAGAVGGAVGGAIGGKIAGTGVGAGLLTGAIAGFAVGSIAGSFYVAPAAAPGESSFIAAAGTEFAFAGYTFTFAIPVVVLTPAAAAAVMAVASSIYTANAMDKAASDVVYQLQKDLTKLNEYDRLRESAFYTALSQVVDDPNVHEDTDDLNGNTKTREFIPYFAWWWHRRMVQFANVVNAQIAPLDAFLTDMSAFRDYAYSTYAGSGVEDELAEPPTTHSPSYLEREDYKWTVDSSGAETSVNGAGIGVVDGVIVGLLRPLHNFGYDTTWTDGSLLWESGPAPTEMNTWMSEDCNSSIQYGPNICSSAPATYDYLDGIADNLRQMVGFMNAIVPPTFEKYVEMAYANVNSGGWGSTGFWNQAWLTDLETQYNESVAAFDPLTNWESWRYYFYNPGNPSDPDTYYTQLQTQIDVLTRLRDELLDIRDNRLDACSEGDWDTTVTPQICGACDPNKWHLEWYTYSDGTTGYRVVYDCGSCAFNPPCRPSKGGGTIDIDTNDEFGPAIAAIDDLIGRLDNFRTRIKDWSDQMDGYILDALSDDLGGLNPITYRWTDMRGDSRVVVQAGPFTVPTIATIRYGNWLKGKTCSYLAHYTDEDNCWIKVTKYPPTNVSLGSLGKWNPFIPGVSKVGRAYFGIRSVGLKAKDL